MTRPLRFGFRTNPQSTTYADLLDVWREADRIPAIEHAWLFDHFAPINGRLDDPCYEGWTTLAALAATTTRLRLGVMVAGNTYRHPAVLTKIAITTDVISGGRLDFGIGAGWNAYEHASLGIPLYAPGERIRRLDEAGEQLTLRVVAKHADVWNADDDIDTLRHKVGVLHGHCAAESRDPAEIEISSNIGVNYDDLDSTVREAQGYVDAGVTHLVLNLRPPFPAGIIARLAAEVIPRIEQR